jgi:WD40 repeat protein
VVVAAVGVALLVPAFAADPVPVALTGFGLYALVLIRRISTALPYSDSVSYDFEMSNLQIAYRIPLGTRSEFVVFSPDGRAVCTVAAGPPSASVLWDPYSGNQLLRLEEVPYAPVAFSPDGLKIAVPTNSTFPALAVFDTRSGAEIFRHDSRWSPGGRMVVFSSNGTLIAFLDTDQIVWVFDAQSGRAIWRIEGKWQKGSLKSGALIIALSPDGRRLATGGLDGAGGIAMNVYSMDEPATKFRKIPAPKQVFSTRMDSQITDMKYSPGGDYIAVANYVLTARLCNAGNGRQVGAIAHRERVTHVAFNRDGTLLATASADGTSCVFDVHALRDITRIVHGSEVSDVAFSPVADIIATASSDGSVKLSDARNGVELGRIAHNRAVTAVDFSPDGKILASVGMDEMLIISAIRLFG